MSEPRPRAGRLFVEPVEEPITTESGIVGVSDSIEQVRRVRVLKIGPPETEDGYEIKPDYEVGNEVLVPYHAGREYAYFDKQGFKRTLWLVSEGEVLVVFDDNGERPNGKES